MVRIKRETITLALAVIGTVLGIVNSWWAISSSTVYLSLNPNPVLKREGNILVLPRDERELEAGLSRFNGPTEVVITITNTGRATAWVTGVGFIDEAKKQRFYLVSPDLEAKGRFPLTPNEPTTIDTKLTPELRKHLIAEFGEVQLVSVSAGYSLATQLTRVGWVDPC